MFQETYTSKENRDTLTKLIKDEREKQRKDVSRDKGLNLTEIVKIGKRLLGLKEKRETRNHTVLRSNIVKLLPQVDNDKKLFLTEFMKVMAYADMYFK